MRGRGRGSGRASPPFQPFNQLACGVNGVEVGSEMRGRQRTDAKGKTVIGDFGLVQSMEFLDAGRFGRPDPGVGRERTVPGVSGCFVRNRV